jgi:hypothetical protein
MIQLLLHLLGDYVTQSHWMATNKTKAWLPALIHATIYSVPFLLIGSVRAVFVIWFTHLWIDRFRLARFVVFAKNHLGWPRPKWSDCSATGFSSDVPAWLAVWLLIIADNTMHLAINWGSLQWVR